MSARPSPALAARAIASPSYFADLSCRIVMYREGYVRPVRISRVRLDERGFMAIATSIRIPGLPFNGRSWKFGAAWEMVSARPGYLSAQYGGWSIYHCVDTVARIIEIGSTLPSGKTTWDDLHASIPPEWPGSWSRRHGWAGTAIDDLLEDEYFRCGSPDGRIPDDIAKLLRAQRSARRVRTERP